MYACVHVCILTPDCTHVFIIVYVAILHAIYGTILENGKREQDEKKLFQLLPAPFEHGNLHLNCVLQM